MPKLIHLFIVALLTVCSTALAAVDFTRSTGDLRYDDGHGHTLPYRVFLPPGYDPAKTYPLVLFFHGAGERESDNLLQCNPNMENLYAATQGVFGPEYQAILVAPQCPKDARWVEWDWHKGSYTNATEPPESVPMHSAMAIFEKVLKTYSIDHRRIYITGISMGAFATWYVTKHHPGFFAAAMPLSGGGNKDQGALYKNLPIWAYQGDPDPIVPTTATADMFDAITAAGGKLIFFSKVPGVGHGGYNRFYDNQTYQNAANQTVFQWMFAQKLAAKP